MDEQRFYTASVGGSNPSLGTVAMVYRCARQTVNLEGEGSIPRGHPKQARRRGRVGAGCKPVAFGFRGFESLHLHNMIYRVRYVSML